jgi:hypothetical protein
MSAALPRLVAPQPSLILRVRDLRDEHARLWETTPPDLPTLGPRVGPLRHLGNARAAARLIDELAEGASRVPEGEREREWFREAVRERMQRFGAERLGWPDGYRRLVFGDAFFEASLCFAREARRFDPSLSVESLWQALRNVWIGNSLQMILDLEVSLSQGLFAYSMLYPLTDNLLDDPKIGSEAKRAFSQRLGRRLAGSPVAATSESEGAVFRLVGRIEEEFPRHELGDVHESLLAIHRAQTLSLSQQDDPRLTDAEILAISCDKGGTSVLADLYLVSGEASREEERFAFGYGVFLQLLDDLQDAETDLATGHETLFARAARRGPLDLEASRLARFIDRVLDGQQLLAGPELADRKDLIRRNCRSLLVGAVVDQPQLFSRRFRRRLGQQWPFTIRAMAGLRRRAQRRYDEARRTLERRTGATSPIDWLLAQPELLDDTAAGGKRRYGSGSSSSSNRSRETARIPRPRSAERWPA